MKCAVLCNGPSRVAFNSNQEYDYVIGCNIPWNAVDESVILDYEVVDYLAKNPKLIRFNIRFGKDAWRHTDEIKARKYFTYTYNGLIDPPKEPYYSSGHAAAQLAIDSGYTEIDIYGCDSYFDEGIESYTHKYVNTNSPDNHLRMIAAWKVRWDYMVHQHKEVKFNFIRE